MKAASLKTSERLQRVDKLLSDGAEYSTWDIVERCRVCAVNSIIAELRANGRTINTRKDGGVYYYRKVIA